MKIIVRIFATVLATLCFVIAEFYVYGINHPECFGHIGPDQPFRHPPCSDISVSTARWGIAFPILMWLIILAVYRANRTTANPAAKDSP